MPQSNVLRYSILDLAPVRDGGTVAEALANSLDLARHAEQWGFTRFWLAEHHNMPGIASSATSVLIGYVAAGTRTIRVGSGGIMLPNHAPLVIAEQFGTLATLYPDRIDLGLGRAPGSDRLTAHALGRRVSGEDEFPRQVGELMAYLEPAGPGQRLQAYPGAGTDVPVWLLGSSTYGAQLAGSLGLPYSFASHFAPETLDAAQQEYRTSFRPSKVLDQPYFMPGVPLIAADSDEEAQYLATSALQRGLSLIRGEPIFVPPPVPSMNGLWTTEERRMVQGRMGAAVIGGPETIERKLSEFAIRTGASELIFVCDCYDHAHRLRSFRLAAEAVERINHRRSLQ